MDQHPTTVSRGVRAKAKSIRQLLGPEVRETFVEIGGSITFDLWTEDHTKTSYVGLTAHYCRSGKVIDNTVAGLWLMLWYSSFVFCFQLLERVLFTSQYDLEKKTAVLIRKFLNGKLLEYGIKDTECSKVVFVTDEGINVVNACKKVPHQVPLNHMACAGHLINTVLRNTFSSKEDPAPEEAGPALRALDACKALVTHFTQTGAFADLPRTLKQVLKAAARKSVKYLF